MANRNRTGGFTGNRRGDFNRNFGSSNYGRSSLTSMNPWQGGSTPGVHNSTEATLMLANNLINNLLSNRQSSVPSLMDINVRRDFGYGQSFNDRRGPNRMGGHGGVSNRRGGNTRQSNSSPRKGNKQADKPKTPKKDPNTDGEIQSEAANTQGEEQQETEGTENQVEQPVAEGEEKTAEKKSTPYDDINSVFLVCHICEKKMWDGRSFDNHIRGRAHFVMMEKIRESYKMTADAMRQEQRIAEMRKEKRGNWGNNQGRRVFCAMCDLYVTAEGAHRRSAGHQKLKRYLHPSCNVCKKEMPTRIEYEEHKLTPQHMRVLQEKSKEIPQLKNEVMQMSSMQEELSLVRSPRNKRNNRRNVAADTEGAVNGEAAPSQEGGEVKEEYGEGEVKPDPEPEQMNEEGIIPQDEGLILDYIEGDDLTGMTKENLPKYQPDRRLGISYIQDYTCKQCTLCKKLFDSEETAEVHTRTYVHFQSFIKLLHSKGNFKKQEAAKRDAENEESAEGEHDNKKPRLDTGDENVDQSGDNNWEHNAMNGDENEVHDEVMDQSSATVDQDTTVMDTSFVDPTPQQEESEEVSGESLKKSQGRPRRNAAMRGRPKNRI